MRLRGSADCSPLQAALSAKPVLRTSSGPSEDVLLNVECPTWLGDVLRSVERTVVRTAFERSERWFGKRVSVTEASHECRGPLQVRAASHEGATGAGSDDVLGCHAGH